MSKVDSRSLVRIVKARIHFLIVDCHATASQCLAMTRDISPADPYDNVKKWILGLSGLLKKLRFATPISSARNDGKS